MNKSEDGHAKLAQIRHAPRAVRAIETNPTDLRVFKPASAEPARNAHRAWAGAEFDRLRGADAIGGGGGGAQPMQTTESSRSDVDGHPAAKIFRAGAKPQTLNANKERLTGRSYSRHIEVHSAALRRENPNAPLQFNPDGSLIRHEERPYAL